MLPETNSRRAVLEIFFETYLEVWAQYGEMITTSEELDAVAYIYDETLFEKGLSHSIQEKIALFKSLKMLKYISFSQWRNFHDTLSIMSSDWIVNYIQEDFIHLDLIGVKENARGKGHAKKIINYTKGCALERGISLTLETQNPMNEKLYSHFGFKTCETIIHKALKQYCMIYRGQ